MSFVLNLHSLLRGVEIVGADEALPESVSSICSDSRIATPGCLFVALRGLHVDGARYIDDAVARGAVLVVREEGEVETLRPVPSIRVRDAAQALGVMASNYYDNPSRKLSLVGVTGTNGKTSVATYLYHVIRGFGHRVGLLSTVENRICDTVFPATHTTPDPLALQELLYNMVEAGCTYAFMEVSSHALVQKRVEGVHFSGALFTNLTRDHIDYHQTFSAYRDAKQLLFNSLPSGSFALTNIDDPNGRVMVQNSQARVSTYSLSGMADYKAEVLSIEMTGSHLRFGAHDVWVSLLGVFNVYNLLAVYGVARELGFEEGEVLRQISLLRPVAGRFDYQLGPGGRVVIVDYAHTPDALRNVLETIRSLAPSSSRIITVFGAGGDRDRGKRPEMAAVVSRLSDWVVLTSDNPRGEKPEDIIAEIRSGIQPDRLPRTLTNVSRREGIRTACMLSRPGDFVLVAGKGHETYQETRGERVHFDDREEVRLALSQLNESAN